MNSQSVFDKCQRTALCFVTILLFVHGPVQAADVKTGGNRGSEPCQLTTVEKYLERHPESQWPPSRREELRRCDNPVDQQGENPSGRTEKVRKK